jgi:hypothetical protein
MKQSSKIAVGTVLVLVLFVALGYALMTGGGGHIDPTPTPTPTPVPGSPSFTQASSGVYFIITFADGSTKKIDSSGNEFSGPYSIISGGATVTNIQILYYITPVFTNTVADYVIGTSSLTFTLYDLTKNNEQVYQVTQELTQQYSPGLVSGHASVITSASLSSTQLEGLATYTNGDNYKLVITGTAMPITLNFAGGISLSRTATAPSSLWNFGYTSSGSGTSNFESISVSFSVSST